MSVRKVKVGELTGAALDWAAAKCEGAESDYLARKEAFPSLTSGPSSNWAQGGSIIGREKISLCCPTGAHWVAWDGPIAGVASSLAQPLSWLPCAFTSQATSVPRWKFRHFFSIKLGDFP